MKHDHHPIKYRHGSLLRDRKGITIFEAIVSMVLVSTTLAISIPAFKTVNLQRKSIDERLLATTALANLGERIAADNNWNSLTPDKLKQYQTKMVNQLDLKELRLTLDLIEKESDPTTRQIRLQLSWKNPHGQIVDPIPLSIWFHRGRSTNE